MGLELASPELTDFSRIKEEGGLPVAATGRAAIIAAEGERGYWGGPIEDGPMEFEGASNGARVNPP